MLLPPEQQGSVPSIARFVRLGFTDDPPPTPTGRRGRVCVTATGAVRGRKLGPARLGRTRKAQRRILKGVHRRTGDLDSYCAVGEGTFKVAYPTARS